MKIDARKLKTDVQQEKRMIAVKLRNKGMSNQEIAEIVNVYSLKIR